MSKKAFLYLGSSALGLLSVACVAFLLAASGGSRNGSQDRIRYAIDSSQVAAIRGTAHPLAQSQFDRGRLSPEQQLGRVSLTFRLSAAQQADLQGLLREQQDRSSPNYHRWLTPEQYAGRFGMTQNDLAKIAAWLQSQGLNVDGISRNHNEISFSGSVGQVEYALKTELHNYSINGEEHFANATDVALPAAFSGEVLGVRGLNTFAPKPRVHKVLPRFTSNLSGNHFVIPGDFATIYNIPSTINSAVPGTGQTIAVVGQTTISTTDIDAFRTAAGLPARTSTNFTQTQVSGTGTAMSCAGDLTEADLDLEWSEGVATGATINYVYAGIGSGGTSCTNRTSNVFDALLSAIDTKAAPIISISYGNCESGLGNSFVLTVQQWAQQANAQGQTISGPAGDSGAADCDTGNSATQGLQVDVPAAIPEVTGVGGSEFMGDPATCPNTGCAGNVAPADPPFWLGATTLNSGPTAQEYIPEEGWNDTAASLALSPPQGLSAGGGGASTIFGKPSWQAGTGVPSDGSRDVPDIALNASPFHDSYLTCSQDFFNGMTGVTSCANGFRSSSSNTSENNLLDPVGGTSAGAPTFAGILAVIAQATNSTGGLGNVNPMLYSLAANSPSAFHDITSGNNQVPCTTGSTDCQNGGTIGFTAGTGYDQVTGLGSLNVANLISAWQAAIAPPGPATDFAVDGLVTSSSAPGQTATSKVTVTALNGFTGAVNLACSATAANNKVSCSLNPNSVTFTSGGAKTQTSTLSVTASAGLRLPNGLPNHGLWLTSMSGVFAGVFLCAPRRRRLSVLFGLMLLVMAIAAIGCGGSSHSTVPPPPPPSPVTYIVTVSGTGTSSSGSALSHSTSVSFTVQ